MYRPTEGKRPILLHLRHLFLGLALLLLGLAAQARPLSLVLFPGDPATLTAVNAVQQLQREPALQQVRFHIASSSQPSPADLEALAKADLALIYNMGRDLAKQIAPAVAEINRRGAKAYAVGSPFEEGERDAGLSRNEELRAYAQAGGVDNYAAMLRLALAREFGLPLAAPPPRPFPAVALWNPRSGQRFSRFEDYAADYLRQRPGAAERVWVGIVFNRVTAQAGRSA
ncbi:MAG: cobaltochelatase subunit CobN, partial [Azospira sp.]|nr:cobaltochelatase subunit CobN [Azospira sp.]